MNKKDILFYVLLALFILTVVMTFLGITKVIDIEEFYLKGMFGAFIIELAGAVYSLVKNGDLLSEGPGEKTISNESNHEQTTEPAFSNTHFDDFIGKEISDTDKIRNILSLAQKERKNRDIELHLILKGKELEGFLGSQIGSPNGVGLSYQLTDSYGKNIDRIPLKEIVTVKII